MRIRHIITLVFYFTLLVNNAFAQPFYLKGVITKCPYKKVYLSRYRGDTYLLADSAKVNASSVVNFVMKKNYLPGIYIISFFENPESNNKNINLLYDGENVEFSCNYDQLPAGINIVKSEKNKLYYNFLILKNRTIRQLFELSEKGRAFPTDNPNYSSIKKQFNYQQKQLSDFLINIEQNYPNSFLYKAIKSMSFPEFPFAISQDQSNNYFREHFLDNVNFSDTILMNSNIFTSNTYSYIQLFKNHKLSDSAQQVEYIHAVDKIMQRCSASPQVKSQVADYLAKGFEQLNLDLALAYIYEKYIQSESCENTDLYDRVKIRVEGNRKLTIGSIAPEVNLFDNDSNQIVLSAVYSPYTLVIFWASWCPHCVATLPLIKKLYNNQLKKQFEIVAISIDTIAKDWQNAIRAGGYKWFNCSDLQGWKGKTVKDYYVYSTPMMFLLDDKKRIIAKPLDINQLVSKLVELKIINSGLLH